MMRAILIAVLLFPFLADAQEEHNHPAPEKLGVASFPTSCRSQTQAGFNRAVALLHSFAYSSAEAAFRTVAEQDPQCAMAYWGMAMTHFHELWDLPPSPSDTSSAHEELEQAAALGGASPRERGAIHALSLVFNNPENVPFNGRAVQYETAMRELSAANPSDVEIQVFYALALISNASPSDREHRRQKQAVDLLEPLYRRFPNHPGLAHYLIHACDNQELAARGLPAARAYARIAPSVPHALHMPSHIFTRLGLWDDSIASNLAARSAAQRQGDTGEQLHAMDYLVYAYLQSGRDQDALRVIEDLKRMQNLDFGSFKIGYAATAMPVRYVVERHQWNDAEKITDPAGTAPPQVLAISVWARGLGFGRNLHTLEAEKAVRTLHELEERLRASGNTYWAHQVDFMRLEDMAWSAQAANKPKEAAELMRKAADGEDGIEKLPLTPGPIIPAREQLGYLLLEQGDVNSASEAFGLALVSAPGRPGAAFVQGGPIGLLHPRPLPKGEAKSERWRQLDGWSRDIGAKHERFCRRGRDTQERWRYCTRSIWSESLSLASTAACSAKLDWWRVTRQTASTNAQPPEFN